MSMPTLPVAKRAANEAQRGANAARERFTAFLCDEASEQVVRQCVLEMALPNSSVHRGNIGRVISHLQSVRSPQALMVDVSGSELPVTEIHKLAEVCEPGVSVVVVGDRNDVGLYRNLIRAGVGDYVVKPLTRSLVQNVLTGQLESGGAAAAAQTFSHQKLGSVVAVLGTRGGVGTTTVATNLAWYLANNETRRVALVDLDIFFGDAALALNVKIAGGLREVLENPTRIDELYLERTMVLSGKRLYVLAAEERLDIPVKLDPEALPALFDPLRKQYHYIVVDVPRQSGGFIQQVMDAAGIRIIVTDQSAHSIRDTVRLRRFFDAPQANQRNIVVLNRAGELGKADISAKMMTDTIGMPIDVTIPYHPKSIISAANAGTAVTETKGPVTAAIQDLASELIGRRETKRRRLFG
jgi:pilus assembly protein CpaE